MTSLAEAPYISFSVCSRNDEYAGGIVERLRRSLSVLVDQINTYRVPAEVIVVDWNVAPDREPLRLALADISRSPWLAFRFIEVPPEVHRRYAEWDKFAVNVTVANNVAIRRARGEFVVPRASDVYYSEALIRTIAERRLQSGCVHRCNRIDVPAALIDAPATNWHELLDRFGNEPSARVHAPLAPPVYPHIKYAHENASGDFLLAPRSAWLKINGIIERPSALSLDHDGLALHALMACGCEQVELPPDNCLYKLAHGTHTYQKVGAEPIPKGVQAVQQKLFAYAEAMNLEQEPRFPDYYCDVIRYWMELVLGLPRRTVAGVGVIDHPPYAEFLFRTALLDGVRVAVVAPLTRKARLQRLRAIAQIAWRGFVLLAREPEAPSAARLMGIIARRLAWVARQLVVRPRYRMNGAGWGLARYKLAEFTGARGAAEVTPDNCAKPTAKTGHPT